MSGAPTFGIQTMKDSKSMDYARLRNKTHQNVLSRRMSSLSSEENAQNYRIVKEQVEARAFLKTIGQKQNSIVVPFGLSPDQKENYRRLKRGSMPSLSLREFNSKMADLRENKTFHRSVSDSALKNMDPFGKTDSFVVHNPTTWTYLTNISKRKHFVRDAGKQVSRSLDTKSFQALKMAGRAPERLYSKTVTDRFPSIRPSSSNGLSPERLTITDFRRVTSAYNRSGKRSSSLSDKDIILNSGKVFDTLLSSSSSDDEAFF